MSLKKVHQLEDSHESSTDESCLRVETVSLVQTKSRQWFADITFFNSDQEDFCTILACQLDTGATRNVLCLDDLSVITQLGDCCDLELTLRDIVTLHPFQVTCYVFASVLNKLVCVISCTWLVITFWRRGFHSRFEQEWRPTGK